VESNQKGDMNKDMENGPKVADWRFGPAQIWYDMLDVSETGEGFNYGFRLKEEVCLSPISPCCG
jgi:transcription initiation factor TFIID subunit 1